MEASPAFDLHRRLGWIRRFGPIGVGLIAVGLVVAVILQVPRVRASNLLYFLAFAVVLLGLDRILRAVGREAPISTRDAFGRHRPACATLGRVGHGHSGHQPRNVTAILIAVSLLLGGIQSMRSGCSTHTVLRQMTL